MFYNFFSCILCVCVFLWCWAHSELWSYDLYLSFCGLYFVFYSVSIHHGVLRYMAFIQESVHLHMSAIKRPIHRTPWIFEYGYLAEYPSNTFLYSSRQQLSSKPADPHAPTATHDTVRPTLLCISISVGEADNVRHIEYQSQDDDGDESKGTVGVSSICKVIYAHASPNLRIETTRRLVQRAGKT